MKVHFLVLTPIMTEVTASVWFGWSTGGDNFQPILRSIIGVNPLEFSLQTLCRNTRTCCRAEMGCGSSCKAVEQVDVMKCV